MGVPSFFRWLQRKYPSIIVNAVEERKTEMNGTEIPVDGTKPNPNYQEFDNLYLDMNGIIHPCTHPENRPAPKTEEEMFALIFEYIDRLFSIVRPRRVLYMAIDGVAPRAKMNQQRSRRFRAAKETIEKEEEIGKIRDKLENQGIPLPPPKKAEEKFDSNCITPGTPFMDRLAIALRYYVHHKVSTDPAWACLQIILSDANVPGEGEHKIMDYIRRQRASPSHDPNTVHCLCGADADLIMLGLATHEANFNILREEFVPNQPRPCELCHQYGHELKDCQGLAQDEVSSDQANPLDRETNFIFIRLSVLREYLAKELYMDRLPFPFDLERAIDDWVFMCFFVGNDFLPHLPSLEIRENAIDRLIRLYKNMVYKAKGWLTDAGDVYLDRVQIMMSGLGEVEDQIFVQRQQREESFKKRQNQQRNRYPQREFMPQKSSIVAPLDKPPEYMPADEFKERRKEERMQSAECLEAERTLKSLLNIASAPPSSDSGRVEIETPWHTFKRTAPSDDSPTTAPPAPKSFKIDKEEADEDEEELADEINFHQPGWKSRYYKIKFGIEEDDIEYRRQVARDYVEGLCWVLKYYYQGCASWDWYFPHHYAPFASDFDDIADFKIDFTKPTKPFNPLEQLMAVFPAASRDHIPEAWRSLMTEENSPLFEFYPPDFEIDLNGKRFAWQGVALLPFVDQEKLLEELAKVYSKLTEEEKRRNIRGADRIFVKNTHPLYTALKDVYEAGKEVNFEVKKDAEGAIIHSWVYLDPTLSYGMAGEIAWDQDAVEVGEVYESIFNNNIEYMDVKPNLCLMAAYRDPYYERGFRFAAVRLDGIKELEPTLKPGDYNERRNGEYRPQIGFTRDRPYANLSDAGHRMVQHNVRGNGNQGGGYRGRGQRDYCGQGYRENGNNNRGRGFHQSSNTFIRQEYDASNSEPTAYVGYFSNDQSKYGMPVPPAAPSSMNYPIPPQPPSFADMAHGVAPPPPSSSYRGGGDGSRPSYHRGGGGGGGRGNYRGNNNRGGGGDHRYNNSNDEGGPRRHHSSHGHDNPRHRPYENRHGNNFRGGNGNNNNNNDGGGGGGGYREHNRREY